MHPQRPTIQIPFRVGRPLVTSVAVMALVLAIATLTMAACGSQDPGSLEDESGIRVVAPADALTLLEGGDQAPALLDVRTPEEFGEGHLDGAVLLDFYRDDFEEKLAELDRDASYVIYCRSGNRSGQTREIMADLGFTNVVDIDGGIVAWQDSGLSTVG